MDNASIFLTKSRYYLRIEYRTKLRAAVQAMPADALWWRANEFSNSVGNLLLHLTGNVRQWIIGGVGGVAIARDRATEFSATYGPTAETLLDELERVLDEVDGVLARVSAQDLTSTRTIQGREVTVLDAIYHVVEHFSLHLGQIILVAKMHAPGAVRFYEDAGGLAKPVWSSLPAATINQ